MGLPAKTTKLFKTDVSDEKIFGVCGGIANYFQVDSTVVRVASVIGGLFTGLLPAIIVYVALVFIMPGEVDVMF